MQQNNTDPKDDILKSIQSIPRTSEQGNNEILNTISNIPQEEPSLWDKAINGVTNFFRNSFEPIETQKGENISGFRNFSRSINKGFLDFESSAARGAGEVIDYLTKDGSGLDNFAEDLVEHADRKKAQSAEVDVDSDHWTGIAGSVVPYTAGTITAVAAAPISAPLAAGAGAVNLGALGLSSFGSGIEAYDQYKDENELEKDPHARMGIGLLYGTAEFAMERLQLKKFMPKGIQQRAGKLLFGSVAPEVLERKGAQLVQDFAKSSTGRGKLIKQLAETSVKGGVFEGGTELLTEVAQEFTNWIYYEAEDREINEEFFQNAATAFVGGSMMGNTLGPLSFGAQRLGNKKRRRKAGKVVIAQDAKGNPFEVIGVSQENEGEASTYQAIKPNGTVFEISEEEINQTVTLSNDAFEAILKGKQDAESILGDDKNNRLKQAAQEQRDQLEQAFSGRYRTNDDGTRTIQHAKLEDEDVFVLGFDSKNEGAFIIDNDGNTRQVRVDRLQTQEPIDFDQYLDQLSGLSNKPPFDPSNPIQQGEEVTMVVPDATGKKEEPMSFIVTGVDHESGEIALEAKEDPTIIEYLPIEEYNNIRQEQFDGTAAEAVSKEFQEEEAQDENDEDKPEVKELQLSAKRKVQIEIAPNGDRKVVNKNKMTKTQAKSLQTSIKNKYPNLKFNLIDQTPKNDDFAEQDWVLVQKNLKNTLDDAAYSKNGESITKMEALKAIEAGDIEGLDIQNDNALENKLKEAFKQSQAQEAQPFLENTQTQKEGLFKLLDLENDPSNEKSVMPSIELLAEKLGYGLTKQGNNLVPTDKKSGQIIPNPNAVQETKQTEQEAESEKDEVEQSTETETTEETQAEVLEDLSSKSEQETSTRVAKVVQYIGQFPKSALTQLGIKMPPGRRKEEFFKDMISAEPSTQAQEALDKLRQMAEEGWISYNHEGGAGVESIPFDDFVSNLEETEPASEVDQKELDYVLQDFTDDNGNIKFDELEAKIDSDPEFFTGVFPFNLDEATFEALKGVVENEKSKSNSPQQSKSKTLEASESSQESEGGSSQETEVGKTLLNKDASVRSGDKGGLIRISDLEKFIGEDRLGDKAIIRGDGSNYSRERIDQLKKDISENGFKEPIVLVYDKFSGEGEASIVEGNHRIAAAKELGYDEVPVNIEKGTLRSDEDRAKDQMFPLNRVVIGKLNDTRGVKAKQLGLNARKAVEQDYVNQETEVSKPTKKEELKSEEEKLKDEFKDLWDQFGKAGGTANTGINPKQIEIAGKLIAKGAEIGINKFEKFIDWVIQNMGASKAKEYFNAFKAAYGANLMVNNPEGEDLMAISQMSFEDVQSFDTEELFNNLDNPVEAKSQEEELLEKRREAYKDSLFDKDWAKTYDEALKIVEAEIEKSSKAINELNTKEYKDTKSGITHYDDEGTERGTETFKQINERKRAGKIKVQREYISDAVRDLKQLGLTQEEIDSILAKYPTDNIKGKKEAEVSQFDKGVKEAWAKDPESFRPTLEGLPPQTRKLLAMAEPNLDISFEGEFVLDIEKRKLKDFGGKTESLFAAVLRGSINKKRINEQPWAQLGVTNPDIIDFEKSGNRFIALKNGVTITKVQGKWKDAPVEQYKINTRGAFLQQWKKDNLAKPQTQKEKVQEVVEDDNSKGFYTDPNSLGLQDPKNKNLFAEGKKPNIGDILNVSSSIGQGEYKVLEVLNIGSKKKPNFRILISKIDDSQTNGKNIDAEDEVLKPITVRELAAMEDGALTGGIFNQMQVGDVFEIGNNRYEVTTRTKRPSKKILEAKGKKTEVLQSTIRIKDTRNRTYSAKLIGYPNGSSRFFGNNRWEQLSRDIEGVITTDLINENNKFHNKSTLFALAELAVQDYNNKIGNGQEAPTQKPEAKKPTTRKEAEQFSTRKEGYGGKVTSIIPFSYIMTDGIVRPFEFINTVDNSNTIEAKIDGKTWFLDVDSLPGELMKKGHSFDNIKDKDLYEVGEYLVSIGRDLDYFFNKSDVDPNRQYALDTERKTLVEQVDTNRKNITSKVYDGNGKFEDAYRLSKEVESIKPIEKGTDTLILNHLIEKEGIPIKQLHGLKLKNRPVLTTKENYREFLRENLGEFSDRFTEDHIYDLHLNDVIERVQKRVSPDKIGVYVGEPLVKEFVQEAIIRQRNTSDISSIIDEATKKEDKIFNSQWPTINKQLEELNAKESLVDSFIGITKGYQKTFKQAKKDGYSDQIADWIARQPNSTSANSQVEIAKAMYDGKAPKTIQEAEEFLEGRIKVMKEQFGRKDGKGWKKDTPEIVKEINDSFNKDLNSSIQRYLIRRLELIKQYGNVIQNLENISLLNYLNEFAQFSKVPSLVKDSIKLMLDKQQAELDKPLSSFLGNKKEDYQRRIDFIENQRSKEFLKQKYTQELKEKGFITALKEEPKGFDFKKWIKTSKEFEYRGEKIVFEELLPESQQYLEDAFRVGHKFIDAVRQAGITKFNEEVGSQMSHPELPHIAQMPNTIFMIKEADHVIKGRYSDREENPITLERHKENIEQNYVKLHKAEAQIDAVLEKYGFKTTAPAPKKVESDVILDYDPKSPLTRTQQKLAKRLGELARNFTFKHISNSRTGEVESDVKAYQADLKEFEALKKRYYKTFKKPIDYYYNKAIELYNDRESNYPKYATGSGWNDGKNLHADYYAQAFGYPDTDVTRGVDGLIKERKEYSIENKGLSNKITISQHPNGLWSTGYWISVGDSGGNVGDSIWTGLEKSEEEARIQSLKAYIKDLKERAKGLDKDSHKKAHANLLVNAQKQLTELENGTLFAENRKLEQDATSTTTNLEPDSKPKRAADLLGQKDVSTKRGSNRPNTEQLGLFTDPPTPEQGGEPIPTTDATNRVGSDRKVSSNESRPERSANSDQDSRGSDSNSLQGDEQLLDNDGSPTPQATFSEDDLDFETKRLLQDQAEATEVEIGNLDNINETLPFLFKEQRGDVLKAESRFYGNQKKGMLFTNGTGTGKTFTGLGIVKRFVKQGKDNVLIVTPGDEKNKDWKNDAQNLNLDVSILKNTKDNGEKGVVITTYANFRANEAILEREWDLVVYDESHKLTQGGQDPYTAAVAKHRQVTNPARTAQLRVDNEVKTKVEALVQKLERKYPKTAEEKESNSDWSYDNRIKETQEYIKGKAKIEEAGAKEVDRLIEKTKVVFLSATPFAYHRSLNYADGFLFDVRQTKEADQSGSGYNSGDNWDNFMMSNLGYRMRYNKLTVPESGVDVGLLERNLADRLVKEGAMSRRKLEVEADYSREFPKVGDELGTTIDQAFREIYADKELKDLGFDDVLRKKWNYLFTQQILEAIKAKAAIPRIKEHLKLDRKVVLFHNYVTNNPSHPFRINPNQLKIKAKNMSKAQKAVDRFREKYPHLWNLDLSDLMNPIDTLKNEFGDQLGVYNGTAEAKKSKARSRAIKAFNTDGSKTNIILIQTESGKEGISLHDKSGRFQRVLMNLGLPTRPTDLTQLEGRIYRLGVSSNAVVEHLTLQMSFEKLAFAGSDKSVANRAKTVENLALGSEARDLLTAIRVGYENFTEGAPSLEQGQGSKESDSQFDALTEFETAKTYYYSQRKATAKNKATRGKDYYATPEPLGLKMSQWLYPKEGEALLEPSAGHGAIARWFPEFVDGTAIEPSYDLSADLGMNAMGIKNVGGTFEDFHVINKFDGIAMNPPFGTGGKTAVEHLIKATKHLNDGGRVIAILPNGPSMQKRFDKWYEDKSSDNIILRKEILLPGSTFSRAGTGVNTKIVILDKVNSKEAREKVQTSPESDFRQYDKVEELFDAIEDYMVIDRPVVDAQSSISQSLGDVQQNVEQIETTIPEVKQKAESFGLELIKNKHTKTGEDIYTVKMNTRLDRDEYTKLKRSAMGFKGRYSSYKGNGAIPGFIFKDKDMANRFLEEAVTLLNHSGGTVRESQSDYVRLVYGSQSKKREAFRKTYLKVKNQKLSNSSEYSGLKDESNGDNRGRAPLSKGKVSKELQKVQKRTVLEGFKESRVVPFKGAKVTNAQDVADLFLIHRSPYIEKGHVLYLDDKGKVLHNSAMTYNLPYATGIVDTAGKDVMSMVNEIQKQAKKVGAKKFMVIHNHPSGNPQASNADKETTQSIYRELQYRNSDLEFSGHVVIDTNAFSFLTGDSENLDNKFSKETILAYRESPEPLWNERASLFYKGVSPELMGQAASELGAELLKREGAKLAVIWVSSMNEITAFDIPISTSRMSLRRVIQDGVEDNLGSNYIIVHDGIFNEDTVYSNMNNGILDIVDVKTGISLRGTDKWDNRVFENQQIGIDKQILLKEERIDFTKPTYYSNTLKALEAIQQKKGTPEQFKAMLLKNGGSQAELEWLDFDGQFTGKKSITKEEVQQFLEDNQIEVEEVSKGVVDDVESLQSKSEKVKTELLNRGYKVEKGMDGSFDIIETSSNDFVNYDEVKDEKAKDLFLEFTELEQEIDAEEYNESDTKYSDHVLPGGKNYKELLLTLPSIAKGKVRSFEEWAKEWYGDISDFTENQLRLARSQYDMRVKEGNLLKDELEPSFKSSHWSEPNILAHIRFNERTDANGDKVLFLEELQSDWAQKGKKKGFVAPSNPKLEDAKDFFGFTDEYWSSLSKEEQKESFDEMVSGERHVKNGVPNMPFKQTPQWVSLAMRRMVRYASENGFDRIAWTTGEQQAERYDLSKQVDRVEYELTDEDNELYGLSAFDKVENEVINEDSLTIDQVSNYVGKDIAQKIKLDAEYDNVKVLKNQDLKVGGDGMKSFYNNIVPSVAKKLLKKLDKSARVEPMGVNTNKFIGTGRYQILDSEGKVIDSFTSKFRAELELKKFKESGATIRDIEGLSQQLSFPITPAIKQKALFEGQPLYKVDKTKGESADFKAVKKTIENITRNWKNAPLIEIHQNAQEIYEAYPDSEFSQNLEFVPGMFYRNRVIINAAHPIHLTQRGTKRIILHEAIGHFGLQGFIAEYANDYEKEFNDLLIDVFDSKKDSQEMIKLAFTYFDKMPEQLNSEEKLDMASELLAIMAERSPSVSVYQKIANWFRKMLRKIGINVKISQSEINALIANAYKFVVDDQGVKKPRIEINIKANLKGPQTATKEFHDWFGNSKVVDENGKPLVVYHGSLEKEAFNEFEKTSSGSFFAENKSFAEDYGDARDFYLSIKNPFDILNEEMFNELRASIGRPLQEGDLDESDLPSVDKYDDISEGHFLSDTWGLTETYMDKVKSLGYDGAIVYEGGNKNWVAFEPTQIKSATSNSGDFNPQNPDIRYKKMSDDQLGLFSATPEQINNTKRKEIQDKIKESTTELKRLRKLQDKVLSKERSYQIIVLQKEILRLNDKLSSTLSYVDATTGGEQTDIFSKPKYKVLSPFESKIEDNLSAKRQSFWTKIAKDSLKNRKTRFIQKYVDSMHRAKSLINSKTDGNLKDSSDFYTKENLAKSKVLEQSQEFIRSLWTPLITNASTISRKFGVNTDQIGDYLYALHAGERNDKLREKYEEQLKSKSKTKAKAAWEMLKKMEDNPAFGSGMSKEEAGQIISEFESAVPLAYRNKLREQVQSINTYVNRKRLTSGMISQEQFVELQEMYQDYVPLRGWSDTMEIDETVYSPLIEAKGRESKAGNPIPFLMTAAQEAIMKGERNIVLQSLLEFVKEHPDRKQYQIRNSWLVKTGEINDNGDDVWVEQLSRPTKEQIENGDAVRTFSKDVHKAVQFYGKADTVITVKVEGKRVFMEFADKEIARVIKNMSQEKVPSDLVKLRTFTRWLSSMYTQYSPEFGVRNLIRDVFFGMFNIANDQGGQAMKDTLKKMPKSMKTLSRYFWKEDYTNTRDGRLLEMFMKEGAMTGYSSLETASDAFKQAKKDIEKADPQGVAKVFDTASKPLKDAGKTLLHGIETYNKTFENAIRFSYFKVLLDQGVSPQQAAIQAKDLTVNFNRKGDASSFWGSVYIFFNASVQGNMKLLKNFTNPKTRKTALMLTGSIIATGFLQAVLFSMFDDEDEEGEPLYASIPDYVKRTHFVLPGPNKGSYIKIPLPYGLNVFYALGESIGSVAMGNSSAGNAALGMLTSASDSFSPIGGVDLDTDANVFEIGTTLLAPSIAQPAVELAFNRTFTGAPIFKEPFANNGLEQPNSQMYMPGVNPIIRNTTDLLNRATGGDEVLPGWIDINPEWIEHGIQAYLGGPASFAKNVSGTASTLMSGDNIFKDPNYRKIPFFRNYVQKSGTDYMEGRDFYENAQDLSEVYDNYKAYEENDPRKALSYQRKNLKKINLYEDLKYYKSEISTINKDIAEANERASDKRLIDRLYDERTKLYKEFNRLYKKHIGRSVR